MAVESPKIQQIGDDLWTIEIVVHNDGYLPSSGSFIAMNRGDESEVSIHLEIGEGQTIVRGNPIEKSGTLEGFSGVHRQGWTDSVSFKGASCQRHHLFSWVIGGKGSVTLTVDAGKAGRQLHICRLKD